MAHADLQTRDRAVQQEGRGARVRRGPCGRNADAEAAGGGRPGRRGRVIGCALRGGCADVFNFDLNTGRIASVVLVYDTHLVRGVVDKKYP